MAYSQHATFLQSCSACEYNGVLQFVVSSYLGQRKFDSFILNSLFSFLVKIYKVDVCLQFVVLQFSNVPRDIRLCAHSVLFLHENRTLCTADLSRTRNVSRAMKGLFSKIIIAVWCAANAVKELIFFLNPIMMQRWLEYCSTSGSS